MRRLVWIVTALFVAAAPFAPTQTGQAPRPTRAAATRQRMVQAVLGQFAAWDANQDGQLETEELTSAVQDSRVTGDAAAAAATLTAASVSPKAPKLPPLTRDYFQSDDATLKYLTTQFGRAERRLKSVSQAALFDPEGPTLPGCKQGALGDCYLVAATGAVITRDPSLINKMIQWQPKQNLFQVNYPDGFQVEVPALTQGEMAMGGAGTADGLWLRVLEKAWGLRQIRTSKRHSATDEPIDVMGHGGSSKGALEAMTGHTAKSYRLGGSKRGAGVSLEDLRAAVQAAIASHHLAVASTPKGVTVPGISSNHAYAILGFDPTSDLVEIWNPHVNRFTPKGDPGKQFGYQTAQGRFSMPLADFRDVYGGLAIETDKVKSPPVRRQ